MSDGQKSCFGFGFLILGLVLAIASLVAGGIGELITFFGGNSLGINVQTGLYIAIGVFVVLFAASVFFLISIRNWAWLPAIAGGVYTILPDLILGPEDDILALVLGVLVSGLLAHIKDRREDRSSGPRPESPPKLPGK